MMKEKSNPDADLLLQSLWELVDAMRKYEGDVGGDVPSEHARMMRRAEKVLSGYTTPQIDNDGREG